MQFVHYLKFGWYYGPHARRWLVDHFCIAHSFPTLHYFSDESSLCQGFEYSVPEDLVIFLGSFHPLLEGGGEGFPTNENHVPFKKIKIFLNLKLIFHENIVILQK